VHRRIRRKIWTAVIGALVAANLWLGAAPGPAGADVRLPAEVAVVADGAVVPAGCAGC
jgi:hypothetical protein